MEQTPFAVTTNMSRRLVTITMSGFWDMGVVDAFRFQTQEAIRRFVAEGCPADELLILIDRRDQPAQPQDVVAAIQRIAAENNGYARRSAVLVGGALNKMQTGRINQVSQTNVFTSEDEALAWLLS